MSRSTAVMAAAVCFHCVHVDERFRGACVARTGSSSCLHAEHLFALLAKGCHAMTSSSTAAACTPGADRFARPVLERPCCSALRQRVLGCLPRAVPRATSEGDHAAQRHGGGAHVVAGVLLHSHVGGSWGGRGAHVVEQVMLAGVLHLAHARSWYRPAQ